MPRPPIYNELEARLHDLFWAAEGESAELPLLENFLRQYPGTSLELGCGSGRLLLPLMAEGYLIEGLDNSEEMLQLCREQAGELDPALDPVLHQASIEDFQAGAVYGSIIIPAFTLQLVSPEKISASLLNIHQHLHPGGGLYLTLFIPWAEITGDLEESSWFLDQETAMRDGNLARCHTRFEIKRLSQQLTRDHRYEIVSQEKGIIETSTSTQQLNWYWRREIEMLLHHAGFSIQEIIGDFIAGAFCDDNSQIMTVIASRDPDEMAPD